jgi:hypothetical protein
LFRFGFYASSATTGLPTGSPLLTSNEIDMSTTGWVVDTTTSTAFTAGSYWIVLFSNNATAQYRRPGSTAPVTEMGTSSNAGTIYSSFTGSWTYSSTALPNADTVTWLPSTSINTPWVSWRTQQ